MSNQKLVLLLLLLLRARDIGVPPQSPVLKENNVARCIDLLCVAFAALSCCIHRVCFFVFSVRLRWIRFLHLVRSVFRIVICIENVMPSQ